LVWPDRGSTTLESSMLTITPPMYWWKCWPLLSKLSFLIIWLISLTYILASSWYALIYMVSFQNKFQFLKKMDKSRYVSLYTEIKEQTFRLFIFLTTVISRRKNQWYIVSQLLLEQNIWQAWLLMFLPTKLSVLLKKIFFVSLKSTKITLKIQISEVCDLY
jgi:hypothetical protein